MSVTQEEFVIYSNGLSYCSVCTSLRDIKEIEERVNRENPTGIPSKWAVSKKKFKTGTDNPHPCNKFPETHKHYLMSC